VDSNQNILLLGQANSVHFSNYLKKVLVIPSKVSIFNLGSAKGFDLSISEAPFANVTPNWLETWLGRRIYWWIDRLLPPQSIATLSLARALSKMPMHTLVIAQDLQISGYVLSRALRLLRLFRFRILSDSFVLLGVSLGNDLYHYPKFWNHRRKLRKILGLLSGMEVECTREIATARSLKFTGLFKVVSPNTPVETFPPAEALLGFEDRYQILVKGYSGKWGLGHKALWALSRMPSARQYEIKVYSSSTFTKLVISYLACTRRLQVSKMERMKRSDFQEELRKSLMHIGASRSDGLATTSLEAACQGAIVVQSATACAAEYLQGIYPFFIEIPDSSSLGLKQALRQAFTLSHFRGPNITQISAAREAFSPAELDLRYQDYLENFLR
jgi:hypothetical protein